MAVIYLMLLLQAELEGTMLQAEQAARGYEEEQQRLARLLDLRSTRLHQLEGEPAQHQPPRSPSTPASIWAQHLGWAGLGGGLPGRAWGQVAGWQPLWTVGKGRD